MYRGMFSIGPGRYSALAAMMSSNRSGRSFLSMSRTPAPSTWNTPTVSPRGRRRSVPVQPFELQRDRDQPGDALICVALLLQRRLGGERLFEGDRVGRVVRDELAQAAARAAGHGGHPPDIAQDGAGPQLAE